MVNSNSLTSKTLGLILVGTIWGITNPLLEKGSESEKSQSSDLSVNSLVKTLLNFRFLIPFAVNQLGSGLYYYFMGKTGSIVIILGSTS